MIDATFSYKKLIACQRNCWEKICKIQQKKKKKKKKKDDKEDDENDDEEDEHEEEEEEKEEEEDEEEAKQQRELQYLPKAFFFFINPPITKLLSNTKPHNPISLQHIQNSNPTSHFLCLSF